MKGQKEKAKQRNETRDWLRAEKTFCLAKARKKNREAAKKERGREKKKHREIERC